MNIPFIFRSDSYKYSHAPQYPPGTEKVYSYLESRGGKFPETVFYGLQYYLDVICGSVIEPWHVGFAKRFFEPHMGVFNAEGFRRLVEKHKGTLPVRIKAVPEGTVVPVNNVLMTIENTDPEFYWLTNWLETYLLKIWYPITVSTLSYNIKKVIKHSMLETCDTLDGLDFKLHDFGFRGVSSDESAAIGGSAHLVNFKGSDTPVAEMFTRRYYKTDEQLSFSVPASEHSTMTSWGKANESSAYENMLNTYPTGYVSAVSDSYDILNACESIWGEQLKDKVLSRDGVLVIRPDSGDPLKVVPKCLEILSDKFGFTVNSKGYKVLHPKVRLIQGDGVNFDSIGEILYTMKHGGWSADNITFGMGGALLQSVNRDTQKFAIKCSAIVRDGGLHEVFKEAPGKESKRGRLKLVHSPTGELMTVRDDGWHQSIPDILETVFENGEIKKEYTFKEIRERAKV